MSPLDVSQAKELDGAEFDRWLGEHGADQQELIVAVYQKGSGKQTVTFDEMLETAMRHGLGRYPDEWDRRRALRDPLRASAPGLELVGTESRDCPPADRRGADDARRRGGVAARAVI
jgi:hypothetical protein